MWFFDATEVIGSAISVIRNKERLMVADTNRDIMVQSFDKQLEQIRCD